MKKIFKSLFSTGTKTSIKTKTKGQDFKVARIHMNRNSDFSNTVNNTVTPETVELVKKDIIIANNTSLKKCGILIFCIFNIK